MTNEEFQSITNMCESSDEEIQKLGLDLLHDTDFMKNCFISKKVPSIHVFEPENFILKYKGLRYNFELLNQYFKQWNTLGYFIPITTSEFDKYMVYDSNGRKIDITVPVNGE